MYIYIYIYSVPFEKENWIKLFDVSDSIYEAFHVAVFRIFSKSMS